PVQLETPPHAARWWIDALWLLVLFGASSAWCVSSWSRTGATYDEPFYLTEGLNGWRVWTSYELTVNGVMPLPCDAATLPLYLRERHRGEKIDDPLLHIGQARAVTLGWWLLLLVSVLRLGRAVGCPSAGRIASGLVAADPNFLAHAALAT